MNEELTPWHDGFPEVGIWQIKRYKTEGIGIMYSYFDGIVWRGWSHIESFNNPHLDCDIPSKHRFIIKGQYRKWRGLANKPK